MSHYYDDRDYYFYPPDRRASSEWSASPSAGIPMTREPSGESAVSTYSNDSVRTPNSEYGAYDPLWSPIPTDNRNFLWSNVPDSSYETTFSPISYDPQYMPDASEYAASNENGFNGPEQGHWWELYDFIALVDPGQQAYWRLKPGISPTAQLPVTRPAEDLSTTAPRSQSNEGMVVCLEKGCTKSFRRKADLERHLSQMHTPTEKKSKYPCDWKRCQRAKDPFHRRDHQRDHYREYHHEDLMRRGSSGREDQRWWSSRVVNHDWWRCARCLTRVKVDVNGYLGLADMAWLGLILVLAIS
ncbi:hypothetical protein NUW58_g4334 [Xylaria curta]|uniref:Uncharacterized protein n=1 Tax=Xylaria curta TaxID=42375 RepID=A0ACC1P952_9PEZI|nr:hypothetical protein NUW58_g4334 [Xylaria curta]